MFAQTNREHERLSDELVDWCNKANAAFNKTEISFIHDLLKLYYPYQMQRNHIAHPVPTVSTATRLIGEVVGDQRPELANFAIKFITSRPGRQVTDSDVWQDIVPRNDGLIPLIKEDSEVTFGETGPAAALVASLESEIQRYKVIQRTDL